MKLIAANLALALAAALGGCAAQPGLPLAQAAPVEQRQPVTILVSIDGFRPDYLDRGLTPTLSALAATGATGPMRPSFPSKTFPNHWTLVTGLVPDRNGITANKMEDPRRPGEVFTMANVDPFWWDEAKPLWVEAEDAGIRSAAMFWPGSAVPWGGTVKGWGPVKDGKLPQDWQAFSMQVSNTQRVNSVLDWLRRPANIRPQFVTLYFDTVDTAGHDGGPESEEVNSALRDVDAHVGDLVDGLKLLGQSANLVIVSDHGMAATSSERVIALEGMVDPSLYRLIEAGPYAAFEPAPGKAEQLRAALVKPQDRMECWAKENIPARLKYGKNPRVPTFLCLAQDGWTIAEKRPTNSWSGGAHGYDNHDPEMAALFIANGPAFKPSVKLAAFDNTDIAPLIRKLIGLPQNADLDGSLAPVAAVLKSPE